MPLNKTFMVAVPMALSASLVLLAVGCGDGSGVEARYKVSGTVSYKGAPVEKGTISFNPEKVDGRGATGKIAGGAYTLTTVDEGDGAIPGKYKVTVDTREIDEAAQKAEMAKFAEKKKISGLQMPPQEIQAKLLKSAKNSTPGKYLIPETSDVSVEVKAQSNTLNIELKD